MHYVVSKVVDDVQNCPLTHELSQYGSETYKYSLNTVVKIDAPVLQYAVRIVNHHRY